MKIKVGELREDLAKILNPQANPFSLFLILILLLQAFGEPNGLAKILKKLYPEGPKGGER
jgi:hypothetical protein